MTDQSLAKALTAPSSLIRPKSGFRAVAVALAFSALLVGCGGGSSSDNKMGKEQPLPTVPTETQIATATDKIKNAATPAAADMAYNAALTDLDNLSDQQKSDLQTALDQRKQDLADEAKTAYNMGIAGIQNAATTADAKTAYDTASANLNLDNTRKASLQSALDTRNTSLIDSALSAAQSAVANVNDDASDDVVMAADNAIAAAQTAIDDAHLTTQVKAAYNSALSARKDQLAANKVSRNKAMQDQKDQADKARRQAMNAESMLVADAINEHDLAGWVDADGQTPGHQVVLPSAVKAGSLMVERKAKATTTTISLRRDDNGAKVDPTDTRAPADGWTAKHFSFDDNKGAVFTNLGEPKVNTIELAWDVYFTLDSSSEKLDGVLAAPTTGVLTFSTPNSDSTTLEDLNASDFTRGVFLPGPPSAEGEISSVTRNAGYSAPGSFLGVSGSYSCSQSCTITRDYEGDLTFTDNPQFTPKIPTNDTISDVMLTRTSSKQDTDYVTFGYWMTKTTSGGKDTQMITTFVNATGYEGLTGQTGSLRGEATYKGGAAGIYVLKSGDLNDPDYSDGEFVANVELKAQFGNDGGTVSAADQWAVTGMVNDFKPREGDHDLSAWNLDLKKANLGTRTASTGVISDPSLDIDNGASFTGTTSGGGLEGEWNGSFFGNAGIGTTGDGDDYPEAVIGEFNGHFVNGHVAGAFGAEIEE